MATESNYTTLTGEQRTLVNSVADSALSLFSSKRVAPADMDKALVVRLELEAILHDALSTPEAVARLETIASLTSTRRVNMTGSAGPGVRTA